MPQFYSLHLQWCQYQQPNDKDNLGRDCKRMGNMMNVKQKMLLIAKHRNKRHSELNALKKEDQDRALQLKQEKGNERQQKSRKKKKEFFEYAINMEEWILIKPSIKQSNQQN